MVLRHAISICYHHDIHSMLSIVGYTIPRINCLSTFVIGYSVTYTKTSNGHISTPIHIASLTDNTSMMEHFASTLIVISLAVYNTGALNCSYELLEKSLLTQQNKYELSRAFFPPIANPPEFVTVNYSFLEINQNKIWHWSVFTSGFIHPPEVLQYMSLFFGKPHAFYNGSIHLTLEKTTSETIADCAEDLQKMQLLTQRVSKHRRNCIYANSGERTDVHSSCIP